MLVICKVKTVDFKCKFCDKTFWTKNTPGENSQKEHWIKCDQCDYVTENLSNLVKHILSHEAFEVCQYCDFVVKDKKDLKDHEIMVIT